MRTYAMERTCDGTPDGGREMWTLAPAYLSIFSLLSSLSPHQGQNCLLISLEKAVEATLRVYSGWSFIAQVWVESDRDRLNISIASIVDLFCVLECGE